MKWIDLFMIILIITIFVLLFKLHNADTALQQAQTRVEYYTDEIGRSVAKVETLETSLGTIKRTNQSLLDSLKANFDLDIRQIRNMIATGLVEVREVRVPVYDTLIKVDTVYQPAQAFNYRDRWLDLDGWLMEDSVNISYTSYDSLSIVQQRLKGGIQTQILSHNPYTKLRGVTTFEIKKDRRLGVSVFAGPAATLDGFTPLAVGVGVSWKVW